VFLVIQLQTITTVQQHENLQLIVASQVDQLWQHVVSPILALYARISKPLWLNIRSTGAEVAGGQFHASSVTKTESLWSQVPRPRPILEGSKTKTKTKTCKNGSWDQDSSLEKSKSAEHRPNSISQIEEMQLWNEIIKSSALSNQT